MRLDEKQMPCLYVKMLFVQPSAHANEKTEGFRVFCRSVVWYNVCKAFRIRP